MPAVAKTHAPELSDAELEQFWSEGFLRLGQVAPAAEIEALRCRADEILLGNVTYPDMSFMLCPSAVDLTDRWEAAVQGPGGVASAVQQLRTLKYRKVQGFEHDPLFLRYMRHPLFRDATSKIVSKRVSIFRSMFFNKPAKVPGVSKGGVVINWHQDGNPVTEGNPDLAGKAQGGGWGLSIDPRLTIWTALDRTTIENGCLQIIPGSHHSPISSKGDLLNERERKIHAPEHKRVHVEMEQGEALLLHNWTLHRSLVNTTKQPRRGFSVCYIDSETRQRQAPQLPSIAFWPQVFPDFRPADRPLSDNIAEAKL